MRVGRPALATVAPLLALMVIAIGAPVALAGAALPKPKVIRLPSSEADLLERGTSGADWIFGTSDRDLVRAGSGDDEVRTGRGRDRVWGGPGLDRIWSGDDDDRVIVAGDPFYEGRDVSGRSPVLGDTVDCGPGRDTVVVDPNDQTVNCEVKRLVAPGQTPHLDRVAAEIREMEKRTGSDSSEGLLWKITQGNRLPGMGSESPEWVSRTMDCWGATGACDSSKVQGQLTSTIRRIIGNAETVADITSLAPLAYDGFRQAIIDGAADAQKAGRRPLIRMLWGRSPAAPFSDSKLRTLQRDVQAAAPDVRVVAALMANTLVANGYSWNHSKIVAADSKVAWTSGINLWSDSYLQSTNPVTDLGVVVEGPAAASANEFADLLWNLSCRKEGSIVRYSITIVPAKGGAGGCPAKAAPAAPASPQGDIPVMAVGRAGYIDTGLKTGRKDPQEVSRADRRDSGCILPPLPNPMNGDPEWDGNNPSDTALRALIDSAESKVVISQQNLIFPCAKDPSYDVRLIDAIARKVRDGVQVTIAISDEGAKINFSEQYGGSPQASLDLVMKRLEKLMGSASLARAAARRSLDVAPFRFSTLNRWVASTTPSLHAKVIAVDDEAVLVGSQNAYPNQLQEFGYIIEDSRAMADMKRTFLDPLEFWARKGSLSEGGKDAQPGDGGETQPGKTQPGESPVPLPGQETPWVVSVGDSYISGEGGRWAGNSNSSPDLVDALGSNAYFDNDEGTGERIANCHRSRSAPIHIGEEFARSMNFACSGAFTSTVRKDRNGQFKPGLDFYQGPEGEGQLRMLRDFARTNRVKMIAVSIGLNDFNYGPITETCVRDFLTSLSIAPRYCRDNAEVKKNFTAANIAARTEDIRKAYARIGEAMKDAGYKPDDYVVVATEPPVPIAPSDRIRYPDRGLQRQTTGGCGIYNADIDRLVSGAFPAVARAIENGARGSGLDGLRLLKLGGAFDGHRLCEKSTDLVENGPGSWKTSGAVDSAEWVAQIRTASTLFGPYQLLEGFHPNYWGQLAVRNCLRSTFRSLSVSGAPRTGRCEKRDKGLNVRGEPRMKLVE